MAAVLIAAAIALAILTHKPGDTVTVLPSADGHVGTVVVERGNDKQVLHGAYATSRTGSNEIATLTPAEVQQSFGATLQSLPAQPASFLLYFITGTDELTDESKNELPRILTELAQRPAPDVLVIGHTDTVGELRANDVLSAQRAERMKGYLIDIGIPPERIRVSGRGEREPLVPTGDEVDEPRNRRVEINVR